MIVIELFNRRYDAQERQIVVEPVARIEVDGRQLTVREGDPGWSELQDIVLNHPKTKADLTFEDDPELWALTLPEAFRTGETVVKIRRGRRPISVQLQPPTAA